MMYTFSIWRGMVSYILVFFVFVHFRSLNFHVSFPFLTEDRGFPLCCARFPWDSAPSTIPTLAAVPLEMGVVDRVAPPTLPAKLVEKEDAKHSEVLIRLTVFPYPHRVVAKLFFGPPLLFICGTCFFTGSRSHPFGRARPPALGDGSPATPVLVSGGFPPWTFPPTGLWTPGLPSSKKHSDGFIGLGYPDDPSSL